MAKRECVMEKITTPKGKLTGFIGINTPSTKFNKEGIYTANLLLSKEDGEKIAEKIKAIRTEQYKTYGKGTKIVDLTRCLPYTLTDEETGEEILDTDGRYILKTTAKAFIKDNVPSVTIPVFDSKGKKFTANIGSGSTAKLSISLEGYTVAGKTGVSVKLKAVQIIDLVEYGSGNAGSYGFEEEDGYVASDTDEELTTNSNPEDDEEADF